MCILLHLALMKGYETGLSTNDEDDFDDFTTEFETGIAHNGVGGMNQEVLFDS